MGADDPETTRGFSVKGRTGLLAAAAIVAVLLVSFPAYRVFFLLSVGIGVVVAGGLYLYHRLRPLRKRILRTSAP
jgi:hypothetical protein